MPSLKYRNIFDILLRSTEEFINCGIIAAPGKYDMKPYAFGYQKDSPFVEMFDYHIEKMRQTGILDTIKSKYDGFEQRCPDLRFVVYQAPKFCIILHTYSISFTAANHYLLALFLLLLELSSWV